MTKTVKLFSSVQEVEDFIKNFIEQKRKEVLVSENKLAFSPLKFKDHHHNGLLSYGMIKAKGLKFLEVEKVPGKVETENVLLSGNVKDIIPMVFYIGNMSRYIYGKQCDGNPINIEIFKDFLETIVKHECLHIYQLYWLFKHSKNFKQSIKLVLEYRDRIKEHDDRIYEQEANAYMFGKPIQHVSKYMSQFLA